MIPKFTKLALIFFTVFSSVNSFSDPLENLSWARLNQLKKKGVVAFEMPEFHLSHGFFMKADKVCLSGEAKNILEPIKIKAYRKCVKGPKGECERETTVHPSRKIFGYRYECMVYRQNDPAKGCAHWGSQPFMVATEFLIEVFQISGETVVPAFKKEFKVPACKDVE